MVRRDALRSILALPFVATKLNLPQPEAYVTEHIFYADVGLLKTVPMKYFSNPDDWFLHGDTLYKGVEEI